MFNGEISHSQWPPFTADHGVQSDASIVSLPEIEKLILEVVCLG